MPKFDRNGQKRSSLKISLKARPAASLAAAGRFFRRPGRPSPAGRLTTLKNKLFRILKQIKRSSSTNVGFSITSLLYIPHQNNKQGEQIRFSSTTNDISEVDDTIAKKNSNQSRNTRDTKTSSNYIKSYLNFLLFINNIQII